VAQGEPRARPGLQAGEPKGSLTLSCSLNSEQAISGEHKMTEKEIEQKFKADFRDFF
jgi:hypothetical protein